MNVAEAERRIYGDVFACEAHHGHCYLMGTTHFPYLGWMCSCGASSSRDGEPLMFSDHRCGIGFRLSGVLWGLFLLSATFAITYLLVHR